MPFRYTPNQNRYVGSIADLMGRGNDAEAQALIASANAQARAAQASGQAWGGAVQGIANTVSQGITDWNSPAARRQREMDKASKIAQEAAADRRQVSVPYASESVGPAPVETRSMLENVMRNYPDRFGVPSSAQAFTSESLTGPPAQGPGFLTEMGPPARGPASIEAIAQSTDFLPMPNFGPQEPYEGSSDTIMQPFSERGTPRTVEYKPMMDSHGEPVTRGRYTLDNGQYDSAALQRDLIAAGIPLDVANEFGAQAIQSNQLIAAGASINDQYEKSQLAIRGNVARLALMAIDRLGLSPEEAVRQTTPGGNAIPEEQLRQFNMAFVGLTPDQQIQALQDLDRRASALGETTILRRGDTLLDEYRRVIATGQPVTGTSPKPGDFPDYFDRYWTQVHPPGVEPTLEEMTALRRDFYASTREPDPQGIGDLLSGSDYLNLNGNTSGPAPQGQPMPGGTGVSGTESGGASYLNSPGAQLPAIETTGTSMRNAPVAQEPLDAGGPPAVDEVPSGAVIDSGIQPEGGSGSLRAGRRQATQPRTGLVVPGYAETVPQEDSEFQSFPNVEAGRRAQRDLWLSDSYQNRTVKGALERWTGGPGGAPDGYMDGILAAANDPNGNKSMRDVSDAELSAMMAVQQKWEGWKPPTATTSASRSYDNNNPGNIKHTASSRARARNERPPVPELPTLESFEQPQPSLVRDPISGVVRTVPEGGSGSLRAGRRQATQPRTGLTAPGSAVEPALSGQPLVGQEQGVSGIGREFGARRPEPQQARLARPSQTRSLRSSPAPQDRSIAPESYDRDSAQAYIVRYGGMTPTDAERTQLASEYEQIQNWERARQEESATDPFVQDLELQRNSDGVYNIRTPPPVLTGNFGDTFMQSMEFAMDGLTDPEAQRTIGTLGRFLDQRQPADVMKHLLLTTGLRGVGQVERDQVKGRYATSLALRGVVSILNEMREAGVPTGFIQGRTEALYNYLGETSDEDGRLAFLSTRLADMVIAYRRAATGVQFGVREKEDYENMMPGLNFGENLNFARIGGLQAAMDTHLRSFWEGRIRAENAAVMFPELYPSEPNIADFNNPNEIAMLEDGTRWIHVGDGAFRKLGLPPKQERIGDSLTGEIGEAMPGLSTFQLPI
jgi:hypothetical protein